MKKNRPFLILSIYLLTSVVCLLLQAVKHGGLYMSLCLGGYILLVGSYIYLELRNMERMKIQLEADKTVKEALFNLSLDGIYLENEKGEILDCNRSGHEMLGYTRDEMLKLSVRDLVTEDFARTIPDIIPDEMATGDRYVERINKKKDGTLIPTEINTRYVNLGGEKRLVVYARDITERKKMEEELRLLSIHDELTGLYNRRYIIDKLTSMIERLKRYEWDHFSLAMLDLDDFKRVNDMYGHVFGDEVLRKFALTVQEGLRTVDIVGRYGGEEFLVLLPCTYVRDAEVVIERLQTAVSSLEFTHPVKITFSAGLVEVTQERIGDYGLECTLNLVDEFLYKAKREGKNRILSC